MKLVSTFSALVFCLGEKVINWLNKRDRIEKGFDARELFLLILLVWLFLIVVGPLPGTEFAIDKKFLFVNVPNGKISLQPEMQNHGSLKMFIINVIQLLHLIWFKNWQMPICQCCNEINLHVCRSSFMMKKWSSFEIFPCIS